MREKRREFLLSYWREPPTAPPQWGTVAVKRRKNLHCKKVHGTARHMYRCTCCTSRLVKTTFGCLVVRVQSSICCLGEDQVLPALAPDFGGQWSHSPSGALITRLRGDGHENETVSNSIPMQNGTKPSQPLVQHCHTADMSTSRSKHKEGMQLPEKSPQKDDIHVLTAQFNIDAILQGLEGEMIPHMGGRDDMVCEDGEPVDTTLIGDEVEPTLMREADEFSQFEPTHLASLLDRDSLLMSMRPPVTTGQESNTQQLSPPATSAAQVPLSASMVATFPASVDRNDVLRGDLKVSEQVRPVAEGFTECDEHHDEILAESSRESHAGRTTRVQPMSSEEYFSVGQGSELSIGDPLVSRQDTGR